MKMETTVKNARISVGGPTIRVCGRDWELHPQLGPVALDKRGNPIDATKVHGIPEAVEKAWRERHRK